jgi:hypothetical protein
MANTNPDVRQNQASAKKTDDVIVQILAGASILIIAAGGIPYTTVGDCEEQHFLDYCSYAFPCFAAFTAGAAIITKVDERTLYLTSECLLLAGYVSYVASHPSSGAVLAITCAVIALMQLAGFLYLFVRKYSSKLGSFESWFSPILAALMFLASMGTAGYCVVNAGALATTHIKCVSIG